MVINIPSAEDFYNSGEELLNFAWDAVAKLIRNINEAEYYDVDTEEIKDEYWEGANRTLSTSLTVIQQGVEFFLKGRIAEISPYLLIADPITKLSSYTSGAPVSVDFSKFKTIDANDLVKIHNIFSKSTLSGALETRFNDMRERRNAIMHSVSKSNGLTVKEVLEYLLFMHREFFPNKTWAERRVHYLEQSPDSKLYHEEFAIVATHIEISETMKFLSKSEVLQYFGIEKNQRAYYCPKCKSEAYHDNPLEIKLANLCSKEPDEKKLYCPVCNLEHFVNREKCADINGGSCPGNVISNEYGMCLTCGE
ncbi:hypothetical protein [Pantoea sp. JK]|uniref:hypothetical protein n=1 Tax=Pantoea sp. JK TaxID=2871703 RepID=UPI00223762B8|nr:hypothetical protein [Pantoea sp. JK]MCW6034462.1 hypothetical protein [Pantoea sp. JK]